MSASQGLTDSQRAMLMTVDAVLVLGTPDAHVLAARQILSLWSRQHSIFQSNLVMRAESWRRRQLELTHPAPDPSGICERLMNLLALPGDESPGVPCRRDTTRRRFKSQGASSSQRPITDAEVERFIHLIDREGLDAVFDPGNTVTSDDVLFKPPLIVLSGVRVYYGQVAPAYEHGEIVRPWIPHDMEPQIALAFDYALLIIETERKWTWVISDRYLRRLPWGHPCKVTPAGRPGWKLITGLLDRAGLIERRTGQTWRLTREARPVVAEHLLPAWVAAAASDQE